MGIQKPTVLDAARVANELAGLKGAIIDQAIITSTASCLRLILRNPQGIIEFRVEKNYAYIGKASPVEKEPGKAVQALRGYRILSAIQFGGDRIVDLRIEREDRLGRRIYADLILELIPNKGDSCLKDESGNIKWSLKKREGRYNPPPKLKKPTVLNSELDKLITSISSPAEIPNSIYGLNDRDLVNLRLEKQAGIRDAIRTAQEYAANAVCPGPAWIIFKGEQAIGYSLASPVLQNGESAQEYNSALEMYTAYYSLAAGQETSQEKLDSLIRILEKEIARELSKLSSIQKELENAGAAAIYRKYGDLIIANITSIKKGASSARLIDFSGDSEINIELDPAKTVAANAEEYFKRARKAGSSFNILTTRLEKTKKRIDRLENARKYKDNIEELEAELIKLKLISINTGPVKKRIVEPRLPYKRFKSSSGWEIWVGRTNRDNDELTFRIANKEDFWFHAWQAAGSHTILHLPDRKAIPDKQTLMEAASLAAYFSKARKSSKVSVAYTQVRFVHKPRNFPPGKVIVDKEKEIMVKPADPRTYIIDEAE